MSWLSKIQAKTRAEKIRLIWTITAIALVLLIIFWIVLGWQENSSAEHPSFFQDIGNIFKGLGSSKPNFKPPTSAPVQN